MYGLRGCGQWLKQNIAEDGRQTPISSGDIVGKWNENFYLLLTGKHAEIFKEIRAHFKVHDHFKFNFASGSSFCKIPLILTGFIP